MKKVIVILVIIAAALLAPFITGKMIENRFEAKVALINQKITKLLPKLGEEKPIKLEYHAGWFSSSAKTSFGKLVINHHIVHGPYGTFGIAKVDSRFEIPEHVEKELVAFFDGKQPYTMTTSLGFSGTTHFNLHSPAITSKNIPDAPSVNVTWQGLDLSSKFTKQSVSSTFKMPKLAIIEQGKASLLIENVQSKATSDRLLDKELNFVLPKNFKLNGESSIEKIVFESLKRSNPGLFQVNNITTQVKSDESVITNFNVGNIDLKAAEILFSLANVKLEGSVKDPLWILRNDPTAADWNAKIAAIANNIKFINAEDGIQVALDYQQEQQTTDKDNKVSYRELYKATNIDIQVPNYNNFVSNTELTYQINGVPKQQVTALVMDYIDFLKLMFSTGFNSYNSHNRADSYQAMMDFQNKLLASSQNLAVATLQATPEIVVSFKLDGNKGVANVNFNASLVTPETTITDLQQLAMGAIPRINAKLSIDASTTLVDEILNTAKMPTEHQQMLKHEALQRYPIIENNGQYRSEIEFKDSNFYVNGELDPSFLQKYSQEFRNFR